MNPTEANEWKSSVLDEVFVALAAAERIEERLIFKGARILKLYLGDGRQSLDIDSNLRSSFLLEFPGREQQRAFLEQEMAIAIHRHFERQNPVQFRLEQLSVRQRPPHEHPRGWDAFLVRLKVQDLTLKLPNLPVLEIDVAAPECLLDSSVATLAVRGHQVQAYTLERITGEKLRAFLSSLPSYRQKIASKPRDVRAKDLYDLVRIHRIRNLDDHLFWRIVGQEFKLACASRYIDCAGLETFQEQWRVTQQTYESSLLPADVLFSEVAALLPKLVEFFERDGILPFSHPLPEDAGAP